jgi:hypothetical protein
MNPSQRHANRIASLVAEVRDRNSFRFADQPPKPAEDYVAKMLDGLGVGMVPAPEPSPWSNPVVWASIAIITVCAVVAIVVGILKVVGA